MIRKWPVIPAFALGCILCFLGHEYLSISSVTSSALIGLLGSFVTSKDKSEINLCPAAIYSGSFAGMCSSEIISNHLELFIVSLLGGILYLGLDGLFKGIGGKLGTVAFCSVAIFFILQKGLV